MALNVCNWNDKQLDELVDMLKSADYSSVSTFIANNFLCSGSRILTDDIQSTLRATVGTDKKTIVLSSGVFVHASKCSQLDTNQIINILNTTTGSWGTGQDGGAFNRYDIICVKNAEQAHTVADRWFVNDSVVPNTYAQQSANTLLNKAYYDIVVVHGTTPDVVPAAPTGYWAIAEIYVPIGCIALDGVGVVINDTTGTSNSTVGPEAGGKNWVATTRVLRMEFWSSKFNIDHDPATGWHRTEAQGGWHIGADMVRATATEMNQALDGIGGTVTAANLTKLTNGSTLVAGELHQHGSLGSLGPVFNVYQAGGWLDHGTDTWINVPSLQISIDMVNTGSFLLFFSYTVGTQPGMLTSRFTMDGTALNPSEGYFHALSYMTDPQEGPGIQLGGSANIYGVALNVAIGTHILRVQMKTHVGGISSTQVYRQNFTVVKL